MPCLPVPSIFPSIFPSVTCFEKYFLRSLNVINPLTQHIYKLSTVLFSPSSTSQHQTCLYQDPSGQGVHLHVALTSYSFTTFVINCSLKPFYMPDFLSIIYTFIPLAFLHFFAAWRLLWRNEISTLHARIVFHWTAFDEEMSDDGC